MCFVKASHLMAYPLMPVTNATLKLQKQRQHSTCLQHIAHQTRTALLTTVLPFIQRPLGSSAHFQLRNFFFIHTVWRCLQEVHFVWCIKRDQFETENIAEADVHKTAAKTAKCCFNVLFIHSILFECGLFSSCLYIKTQLIGTALLYKVYFASQKCCDFAAHFVMRYRLPKTLPHSAIYIVAVSYTHLTLPTNREV